MNKDVARDRKGDVVRYGQVIQLRHNKSGKWLKVNTKDVGEIEKDCLATHLGKSGNPSCWFSVMPRYKSRSEGAAVEASDQILLEATTRPQEFLHSSALKAPQCLFHDPVKEVNCSSEPSAWKISVFREFTSRKKGEELNLHTGMVVRINHSESNSNLCGSGYKKMVKWVGGPLLW